MPIWMVLKFLKIPKFDKNWLDNDSDFLFSNYYKEIAYLKFYENIKDDGEVNCQLRMQFQK
jgi:hypothetical protein